jgi:hypothetical protein
VQLRRDRPGLGFDDPLPRVRNVRHRDQLSRVGVDDGRVVTLTASMGERVDRGLSIDRVRGREEILRDAQRT